MSKLLLGYTLEHDGRWMYRIGNILLPTFVSKLYPLDTSANL